MGLKIMGIGGSFTIGVKRWVRGGKVSDNIHLGTHQGSKGFKLGREVMLQGFHFFIYGELILLLMVVILALICCTYFWASVKSNDKVLRWDSRS
jgi:hypothetical protein